MTGMSLLMDLGPLQRSIFIAWSHKSSAPNVAFTAIFPSILQGSRNRSSILCVTQQGAFIQGRIFCLTCSYPKLTKDQLLTSAYESFSESFSDVGEIRVW